MTFATTSMFTDRFQLTTENQLNENFNTEINRFWQKNAQTKRFLGVDNKVIHTVSIKTGNSQAIVISQGRNESTLKYKELAYDLNKQGYDLYLIDHRGQGFSERLGGDQYRGHIEQFQDYVEDFNHFISSLDLPLNYQNSYLLSHSMGGTISALYLQQIAHPFQASVFFSPMFSINGGGIPESITKIITYSSAEICSWFNNKACYIFGGTAYKKKQFDSNRVTSSKLRFSSAFNTFEQYPETQLGSPTMRWVAESISATQQALNNASKITIPILIVQAGAATIVNNLEQKQFFNKVTHCKDRQFLNIPGAKHELLLEQDQYRIPALNKALQFLEQSQQNKLQCIK
jgi:lysophospholipase